MNNSVKKNDRSKIIFPKLSYKIVGVLFEVYNHLGPGFQEKHYQRAIVRELKKEKMPFKEQVYSPLIYKEENIGSQFIDFLIDNKIILEIKKGDRFSKNNIDQILNYLKTKKLKLGIIANFGSKELKFKRIINFD